MRLLILILGLAWISPELVCRAEPTGEKVLFEFFSSAEQEVTFAYLNDLKNPWQFIKMEKDGNRFFVYHPVGKEIWYEFVVRPNVWFRRDPFNQFVDSNHPYLKRGATPLTTHRNLNVTYVPSAHFDYFTTGDGTQIRRLDAVYTQLTTRILTVLEPKLAPVHGKKIRYYGGMFEGCYATAGNAEIVDRGDSANSHEIIHVLMHAYPHYGPLAEGIAQCFQQSGNQRPLTEANCSLAAKEKSKHQNLWDVLSDFGNHPDYHMAGSFIYHQLYVAPGARAPFVACLKEFKPGQAITPQVLLNHYRNHTGRDLKVVVREWERWVSRVTESSPVYVKWNEKN
jgi:hypothetical protein